VRKLTRRALIATGGLVGGGLALGIGLMTFAPNRLRIGTKSRGGGQAVTTWIRITPDNEVIALIPLCEMGQGALTGVAMMLAEELDADWERVRIEQAPPEQIYANGYMLRGIVVEGGLKLPQWLERGFDYVSYKVADFANFQITGGSSSTNGTGQFGMRVAGAAARAMLLEAAAARWNVPVDELKTMNSSVLHAASKRTASYGDLAAAAARINPPQHPSLKAPIDYRLIGKTQLRRDIPGKIDGTTEYAIDFEMPDMLYATLAAAPVPGGKFETADLEAAKSLSGVHKIVPLDNAVAVIADGYWQAQRALRAARPKFTDAGLGAIDTGHIFSEHAAVLDALGSTTGDTGAQTLAVEYRVPYLAHATLEPMCATARLSDGHCDVWASTQDPLNARHIAATAAGIDVSKVSFHNFPLGGGFGRKLPGAFDFIEQAVLIAKTVAPRPVKLIWSREEDMQHDFYRPAVLARMSGMLDAEGRPIFWGSDFTGNKFLDPAAAQPIYGARKTKIRVAKAPVHLRPGSWRSVSYSSQGFFMESFVDELAHLARRDPLEYRLGLLADKPRHQALLRHVAAMSHWGDAPLPGRARGVAIVECFGTRIAEVAEVSVEANGVIRVHRVDAAVDCGLVVNPGQALAQIQGGIIFGLSAALHQEITVRGGAVEQRSFPDYEMVRLENAPRVHVEFVESDAPMGGLGEPGVPPIAPAVANAVFALTGKRLRSLPLRLS
jgi:isoquinoline 1-oxidoreductase subunit beta